MSGWTKVRWAQARQVTQLMGIRDRDAPPESVAPAAYCESLRGAGRLGDAVSFVGHALPRFETIAWAARQVAALHGDAPREPGDAAAFAAVDAWLKDPDDALRRAAFDAGEAAEDDSAERLLTLAVWFSGGSLAPAGQAAVNPTPELTGRTASGAVLAAAHRTAEPQAALAAALAAGEAIAQGAPPLGEKAG